MPRTVAAVKTCARTNMPALSWPFEFGTSKISGSVRVCAFTTPPLATMRPLLCGPISNALGKPSG